MIFLGLAADLLDRERAFEVQTYSVLTRHQLTLAAFLLAACPASSSAPAPALGPGLAPALLDDLRLPGHHHVTVVNLLTQGPLPRGKFQGRHYIGIVSWGGGNV